MAKKLFSVGKTMYCPVCERNQIFYGAGKQTFPTVTLKLWTCHECTATVSTRDYTGNTGILQEVPR